MTLDGHKYTFNGKGEFTLIETDGDVFTLQGRMEQAVDPDGLPVLGTVFTAIVARQTDTMTSVQFQVEGDGLQVLVNGEVVTFGDMSVLEYDHTILRNKGNDSVLVAFPVGASVEAKVENGIISIMSVNLPESMRRKTRGLMGTFDGITIDDLIPKDGVRSIPLDSTLEDLHNSIGVTCKHERLL